MKDEDFGEESRGNEQQYIRKKREGMKGMKALIFRFLCIEIFETDFALFDSSFVRVLTCRSTSTTSTDGAGFEYSSNLGKCRLVSIAANAPAFYRCKGTFST